MKQVMVFIDGTAASAARGTQSAISNVYRMNQAMAFASDTGPQITFYFSGVGTRGDTFSAVTGRGLDELIREVYVNLSSNYEIGDEIYIFGWSRGAAAARGVATLIASVGLLEADELSYLARVWELHRLKEKRDRRGGALSPDENSRVRELDNDVSGRVYRNGGEPRIRFLGLFDTVAGNSWDRGHIFTDVNFYPTPLENCVDTGIQVLSIDDRRVPSFSPLLWSGKSCETQNLEQIWMPGVHADVGGGSGGGYLSDLSLIIMLDRLKRYCPELAFDDDYFIARFLKRFESPVGVAISDECTGPRALLWKGKRLGGLGENNGEVAHPVVDVLHETTISIRSKSRLYQCPSWALDLPRISEASFGLHAADIDPVRRRGPTR